LVEIVKLSIFIGHFPDRL